MPEAKRLDFAKLLGFAAVNAERGERIHFQDEAMSDKLGAKIGPPEPDSPELLRDENFAAKLGAKVGEQEEV